MIIHQILWLDYSLISIEIIYLLFIDMYLKKFFYLKEFLFYWNYKILEVKTNYNQKVLYNTNIYLRYWSYWPTIKPHIFIQCGWLYDIDKF
jgi:hypothetical protein